MMFTYVFIESALFDIPSSYTSFILLTSSRETSEEVIRKVPSLFWRGYRFWWCSWCTSCPLKQLCPAIPFCATPFVPSSSSVQTEERLLIFVQEKKRKSCIDCKVLCGIVFPTKSIVVILPSLHYATCLIISLEVAKTNKLESHFGAALIYINVEYTNHNISFLVF